MKIKRLSEEINMGDGIPSDFDPNKHIRETDDIDFLEELLKFINSDLERLENLNNFRVQAKLSGKTPEEIVNSLKTTTLRAKKTAEDRLKELKNLEKLSEEIDFQEDWEDEDVNNITPNDLKEFRPIDEEYFLPKRGRYMGLDNLEIESDPYVKIDQGNQHYRPFLKKIGNFSFYGGRVAPKKDLEFDHDCIVVFENNILKSVIIIYEIDTIMEGFGTFILTGHDEVIVYDPVENRCKLKRTR